MSNKARNFANWSSAITRVLLRIKPLRSCNHIELQSAIDIEPSVVERLDLLLQHSNPKNVRSDRKPPNPAILCLGGCCSAYASDNNPKKDSRELDRFLDVFKTAARLPGQEHDAGPQKNFTEDPWDLTLSDQHDVQSLH